MVGPVTPEAQPPDIEQIAVIVVVGLDLLRSAGFTRLRNQSPITDGIANCRASSIPLWVAPAAASLRHNRLPASARPLPSFALVCVVVPSPPRVVCPNIFTDTAPTDSPPRIEIHRRLDRTTLPALLLHFPLIPYPKREFRPRPRAAPRKPGPRSAAEHPPAGSAPRPGDTTSSHGARCRATGHPPSWTA